MLWQVTILTLLWPLLALPLLVTLSQRLSKIRDGLWAFSRILSWLLVAFCIYLLAWAKLPINTVFGVRLLSLLWLLFDLYLLLLAPKRQQRLKQIKSYWRQFSQVILLEELVFWLMMAFLLIARGFQPDIAGLEKFMDAGFIQSYLKSPTLPASDMWFAGEAINYYSFGHFLLAILTQLWAVDLAWSYNFLVAVIGALFASEVFSLAFNLRANCSWGQVKGQDFTGRYAYNFKAAVRTATLASLLVSLAGNGHPLWYLITQGNFTNYWYPDATRFISHTIHEFPAYSFVVADLHAHMLSMPIVVCVLMFIYLWLDQLLEEVRKQKIISIFRENFSKLSLVIGFLLGVLVMTNTWDVMVYGLLLLMIGLLLLFQGRYYFWPLVASAVLVVVSTLATSGLWLVNFTSIAQGVKLATEHSPLWQLAVLWGPQLLLVLVFVGLLVARRRRQAHSELTSHLFIVASCLLFVAILTFTELFYFADIYTTHQRANTMFKLMFQGFIVIQLLLALGINYLWTNCKRSRLFAWRLVDLRKVLPPRSNGLFKVKVQLRTMLLVYLPLAILIGVFVSYPVMAFQSYYGFKRWQGWDGLAWMAKQAPASREMVDYLKTHESQQVTIVEASGESYSEFALVSAFSGMPTLVGWQVHEWLWRGSWPVVSQRLGELREIYLRPDSQLSQQLLDDYQVKYIVLTDKERQQYPQLDIQGLLSLGEVVYHQADNYLILIQK